MSQFLFTRSMMQDADSKVRHSSAIFVISTTMRSSSLTEKAQGKIISAQMFWKVSLKISSIKIVGMRMPQRLYLTQSWKFGFGVILSK